jgi:hypothetical protein
LKFHEEEPAQYVKAAVWFRQLAVAAGDNCPSQWVEMFLKSYSPVNSPDDVRDQTSRTTEKLHAIVQLNEELENAERSEKSLHGGVIVLSPWLLALAVALASIEITASLKYGSP